MNSWTEGQVSIFCPLQTAKEHDSTAASIRDKEDSRPLKLYNLLQCYSLWRRITTHWIYSYRPVWACYHQKAPTFMSQLLLRLFPQWDCKGGGGVFVCVPYPRLWAGKTVHSSIRASCQNWPCSPSKLCFKSQIRSIEMKVLKKTASGVISYREYLE